MTNFEMLIIGISILTIILTIRGYKKSRINLFNSFVLVSIGSLMMIFIFNPIFLKNIGEIFGLGSGALLITYIGIIILFYFSFFLYLTIENNNNKITKLVRASSLEKGSKQKIEGKEIFVIPVYNEEKIIKKTIDNILNNGYKNILVINDGSVDNTKKILDSFNGLFNKKIIILNHSINLGQGAALETGFERIRQNANVEYVITFDADGQHNIKELSNFYKVMEKDKDIDIALGSRFLREEDKKEIPFLRKIILVLGIIFTYIISGIRYTDTHNGYRVIRKKTLDKLRLSIDGMGHSSEIQDIIGRKKLKFIEVPVNIKYTEYSIGKGQRSSNAIKIAIQMIYRKMFHK